MLASARCRPQVASGTGLSVARPERSEICSTLALPAEEQRALVGAVGLDPGSRDVHGGNPTSPVARPIVVPGAKGLPRVDRLQLRRAAAERGRICAQHLSPGSLVRPNTEFGGTGALKVEKATTQRSCLVEWHALMCRKSPPTSLPAFTVALPPSSSAETSRWRSLRFGSISLGDQLAEHEAALRVADQDHAAPVVVLWR